MISHMVCTKPCCNDYATYITLNTFTPSLAPKGLKHSLEIYNIAVSSITAVC